MRMSVKSYSPPSALSRSKAAVDAACFAVAENVKNDCEKHVPVLTGDLRSHADTSHGNGEAHVMWGADEKTARYARRQYYGTDLHHGPDNGNPENVGTGPYWFESARAEREGAWKGMFEAVYRRDAL